jgi:VacB/RNase II family 3'-5' exoribonuclease
VRVLHGAIQVGIDTGDVLRGGLRRRFIELQPMFAGGADRKLGKVLVMTRGTVLLPAFLRCLEQRQALFRRCAYLIGRGGRRRQQHGGDQDQECRTHSRNRIIDANLASVPINHVDLHAAARQEMAADGFHPEFSNEERAQVAKLKASAPNLQGGDQTVRDMRALLWSSIDNDTSRDLDQIEVAERLPNSAIRILIGIADVDALVPKGTPVDLHAQSETTTVYTGIENFSMLPEELSTDLTSLNENADRLAVVVEVVLASDASIQSSAVYRALVRNKAQLAYSSVGPWLEGKTPAPPKVVANADLQIQLKMQDEAAQRMRAARYQMGALNIDSIETTPELLDGQVSGIHMALKNRASELIEDFMIGANGVTARMLADKHVSSIRRIVKTPERWNRIVELAATLGEHLPSEPDSGALNAFLLKRKAVDPVHSPDLSLAIVKLMGPGEYVVERPGDPVQGHFGLAVHDYTHSTAPNRRFADLVTQRLVKAVLTGSPAPYTDEELDAIAKNCTLKEDAARKVERSMRKRIAAAALASRIGQTFRAVVTGVTPKGTFVRTLDPPAEGLVVHGQQGLDVGEQVQAKLVSTDPQRGFIDFSVSTR